MGIRVEVEDTIAARVAIALHMEMLQKWYGGGGFYQQDTIMSFTILSFKVLTIDIRFGSQ